MPMMHSYANYFKKDKKLRQYNKKEYTQSKTKVISHIHTYYIL